MQVHEVIVPYVHGVCFASTCQIVFFVVVRWIIRTYIPTCCPWVISHWYRNLLIEHVIHWTKTLLVMECTIFRSCWRWEERRLGWGGQRMGITQKKWGEGTYRHNPMPKYQAVSALPSLLTIFLVLQWPNHPRVIHPQAEDVCIFRLGLVQRARNGQEQEGKTLSGCLLLVKFNFIS